MLSEYKSYMKEQFAEMTEEEIKAWDYACKDALDLTEEMKKELTAMKKRRVLKKESEKEWKDKNSEKVKAFFKEHWDDEEADCERSSVIYSLSTMIFDCYSGRGESDELLNEMKETFPDIYTEVLEGYILGSHDT